MIWAIGAGLSLVVAASLLAALRGGRGASLARHDGAAAILADQMAEVDRDLGRGLISGDEAEGARTEIKRRLLRLDPKAEAAANGAGRAWPLLVAAVAVPVLAFGLYAWLGSPGIPAMPFADRGDEQAEAAKMAELTDRLKTRLQQMPGGGATEGWELLAQTYMQMGRFAEAAAVFDRLKDRDDATSATWSRLAEALISAENGIVTPRVQGILDRALELDEDNPAATYYRSFALQQAGQSGQAYDLLKARLLIEGGFAPWMETYVARINRLAAETGQEPVLPGSFAQSPPGPSQDQVEAASGMSAADRDAFIRSMVERLAQRLADEPGDLDGWLRLANAYGVLGEADKARDAYGRAVELSQALPEGDPRRAAARDGLAGVGG